MKRHQSLCLGGFVVAILLLSSSQSIFAAQTAKIDAGKTYVLQVEPCETEKDLLELLALQQSQIEGLRKSIDTLTELLQSNKTNSSVTAPVQSDVSSNVDASQTESSDSRPEGTPSNEESSRGWLQILWYVLIGIVLLAFVVAVLIYVAYKVKKRRDAQYARKQQNEEEQSKRAHRDRHSSSSDGDTPSDEKCPGEDGSLGEVEIGRPHVNGNLKPIDPTSFRASLRAKNGEEDSSDAEDEHKQRSTEVSKGESDEKVDTGSSPAGAADGSAGAGESDRDGDGTGRRDGHSDHTDR